MLRSLLYIHTPEPNADGSRRNNDYSMAILSKLYSCINNEGENRKKRLMSLFIDN
jgi:hypothetical protein